MDRAGAGRRVAKADLAGEFGMRGSHEGGHFFVAHLDVFHDVLGLLQGHIETADAVSGIAIDALQSPLRQSMPNEFADILGHCIYPNLRFGPGLPRPSMLPTSSGMKRCNDRGGGPFEFRYKLDSRDCIEASVRSISSLGGSDG